MRVYRARIIKKIINNIFSDFIFYVKYKKNEIVCFPIVSIIFHKISKNSKMNHNNAINCHSSNSNDDNECYIVGKGEKKDSKSRGKIAADQAEARKKKIAERISQLPKKMQAKLREDVPAAVNPPGKFKNKHVTKPFHTRQKNTQNLLLGEYEEDILAQEDATNEELDEAFEKRWDEHIQDMKEEGYMSEEDEEEERYQTYLGNKYLYDFPSDDMTQWDLILLQEEIAEYEAEIAAKQKDEDEREIYLKYGITKEQREEYKTYEREQIWLEYGLTREQYEAYKIYEKNCGDLAAFYLEPDYANYPDYEIRLKTAIKKHEDEWNAQKAAALIAEDDNDWWVDEKYAKEATDDIWLSQADKEEYSCEEGGKTYNEWLENEIERRKDQYLDSCRQDMRDSMNDDY